MIRSKSIRILALFAAVVPCAVSQAETDLSKFSLSRAAPADAFITVASRGNSERQFLNKYWSRVMDAFWESEIHIDIWDLMTESASQEEIAKIEEIRERFETLCDKVDWEKLTEREFLYTARFTQSQMPYEGVLAGRLESADAAKKNHEAITAIFSELADFAKAESGQTVFVIEKSEGEKKDNITRITIPEAPFLEINLAQTKDVVFITFGSPQIAKMVMQNLNGESSEVGRLVESKRFKDAMSALPAAEDEFVFFDVERMMVFMRGMANMIERQMMTPPNDDKDVAPKSTNIGTAMGALLEDASFIDYMATVTWTEGHRVFAESVTTVREAGKDSPMLNVFTSGGEIKKFEKYIPAEAASFSVSAGINLSKVYEYLIGFMNKNIVESKEMLQHWDAVQRDVIKLNIKQDILDLFGSTSISYNMGNDWVMLQEVTDAKKTQQQLDSLLAKLNNAIKQNAGEDKALIISQVDVAPETKFTQISHGMMMMMGMQPPVVGCADGYLILGSSAAAVRKCLLTGRGDHNNITTNSRWREEALTPKGKLTSISFTDQTNLAVEMQQGMTGIAMGLGFAQMGAAGNAPPQVLKLMQAGSTILTKLGPVVGKMDFFKSHSSYTTFDGSTWHMYNVQNYKNPKDVLTEESPATESASAEAK